MGKKKTKARLKAKKADPKLRRKASSIARVSFDRSGVVVLCNGELALSLAELRPVPKCDLGRA